MSDELLDIMNDRMEVVGALPRKQVHAEGQWHAAFHCWIVSEDADGNRYVVFQLRSKDKDLVPNSLDITAAGHLHAGETPMDGLRELEEELGIEVSGDALRYLGTHVEVYCDERHTNREFDRVYLLREDKPLLQYRVQPNEVSGLSKIAIQDGIDLFSGHAAAIQCQSVTFDDSGAPIGSEFTQTVEIASFAGGERNNYFMKVFLLAERFFAGSEHLYI